MSASPKPRLLVVSTSYPLDRQSASARHIKAYLQGLAKNFEITIVTADTERQAYGDFSGPDPGLVVRFRYAPRRWQVLANKPGGVPAATSSRPLLLFMAPLLWGAMSFKLSRYALKADIIHANWSLNGLVAGIVGSLMGVPVVTTLRGSDVRWAARSRLGKLVLAACSASSCRLVAVSPLLARQVRNLLGRQRTRHLSCIENGADQDLFHLPFAEAGELEKELRFLVIANLVASKRVDLAVRAFARLRSHKRLSMEIIGAGPESGKLQALAKALGVASKVFFHGGLPHSEVKVRLAACHVLVHPSLAEGRSNVVLEAMAAGRAVIASRICGISDLVEDGVNGMLFASASESELAERLQLLVDDPTLCVRLGQAARMEVLKRNLTWQETARKYAGLFLSIAGSRR